MRIESLEPRRLLCVAVGDLPENLRILFNDDGHISRSTYELLSPQEQALIDKHHIEEDAPAFYPDVPTSGGLEGLEADPALPDIQPLTGNGFLQPFLDTTEIPGHTLLRFSSGVGNAGAGPLILTSANSGTAPAGSGITNWINPDGTQNVLQALYSFDGTRYSFNSYRPAGRMVWHNGHGHFHLEGYASYRLLTNVAGQPGPVAKRTAYDNADAVGDKVGFCLVNINSSFTLPGGASSSTLPGWRSDEGTGSANGVNTNSNGQPSTGCGFWQGIHVGHADVYDSIYDGQWIDVTGVPAGNYFLEVTMDANNIIQETNEANNVVRVPFTLGNTGTPGGILPDRFEPNNTFATAANLGALGAQTQPGLTIHITDESDYFKFVATSTGSGTVSLSVADRDVNLYVYDSAQSLLASSTSPNNGPMTESVTVNFVAGQTYYALARGFGTATGTSGVSSGYSLIVNIKPTVVANTIAATASEDGLTAGQLRIERNGPTSSPLAVNFTVGGTATRGVDYVILQDTVPITGNTLSIGNEASGVFLDIVPLNDSLVEPTESITITLGTSTAYVVGGASAGTVQLLDTKPRVTASAFSQLSNAITFDFTLDVGASLQPSDLTIADTASAAVYSARSVAWDAVNRRATFAINGVLPRGRFVATLDAAGVTHALGAPLASSPTVPFTHTPADFNLTGVTDFDDLLVLAASYNATGRTFAQGDANYDGVVNFDDLLLLAANYNLPAVSAAPPPPGLLGAGDDDGDTPVDVLS
jgi:hypothetical protein